MMDTEKLFFPPYLFATFYILDYFRILKIRQVYKLV